MSNELRFISALQSVDTFLRFNASKVRMRSEDKKCDNCLYLMVSISSRTKYRCGYDYYRAPEHLRNLDQSAYKSVNLFYHCSKWHKVGPAILRETQ